MNSQENFQFTDKFALLNDLDPIKNQQDHLLFDLRNQQTHPKKLTIRQRKAKRRAQMLVGKNKGRWSTHQKREYYVFLKIYSQFFISKELRRNDKVFKMMADFIKSRTPDQCRTHHQKLECRYFKISKILQALRYDFGEVKHQEIMQKCGLINAPTAPQEQEIQLIKFEDQNDGCEWNKYLNQYQEKKDEGAEDICKVEEQGDGFHDRYLWSPESQ